MRGKVKKAAALQYTGDDRAPRITAMGRGELAERILKTAKDNNVPVFENGDLVDTLLNFEMGAEIPPELYGVVAEILVFISNMDKLKGESYGGK